MRIVNYNELVKILKSGAYNNVYGPKPSSYEFNQAKQGLNNKKLWKVV